MQTVAATIHANTPLCEEHYRLVLRVETFPATAPGQFIQISCTEPDANPEERELQWDEGSFPQLAGDEWTPHAFLRRPFSLADRIDHEQGVDLHIIHRVVGVGTAWLEALRPGNTVNILGPLGKRFIAGDGNSDHQGISLLVGGGVGIPPLLYLARQLEGRKAVAFLGVQAKSLLPLTITADAPAPTADGIDPLYNIAELSQFGIPALISSDDGSYGYHGRVTEMLDAYLRRYLLEPAPSRNGGHEPPMQPMAPTTIYTCGPEPMLKAIAELAVRYHIPCRICVERAMACGMGTCQSCCIRVKQGDDWAYRLACTDGPVFEASELLW